MSANPARPPLVTLTEEERARALARYRLLQPHLEGGVALTAVARAHALCFAKKVGSWPKFVNVRLWPSR